MREYFQNFHKNNGKFLLWNKTKGITCPLREKFDFQGLPRFSGTVDTIGSCHHFLTKNRTCSQLKLGPARKHERIKYVDQPKFSRDFYVLIFLVNNKELYCITERWTFFWIFNFRHKIKTKDKKKLSTSRLTCSAALFWKGLFSLNSHCHFL